MARSRAFKTWGAFTVLCLVGFVVTIKVSPTHCIKGQGHPDCLLFNFFFTACFLALCVGVYGMIIHFRLRVETATPTGAPKGAVLATYAPPTGNYTIDDVYLKLVELQGIIREDRTRDNMRKR